MAASVAPVDHLDALSASLGAVKNHSMEPDSGAISVPLPSVE